MSQRNPYDDYDSVDMWDDEVGYTAEADPFAEPHTPASVRTGRAGEGKGSTMELPKTLVRENFGGAAYDEPHAQEARRPDGATMVRADFGSVVGDEPTGRTSRQSGGVLHRHKRGERARSRGRSRRIDTGDYEGYADAPRSARPAPAPVPAPEPARERRARRERAPRRHRSRRRLGRLLPLAILVACVVGVYWVLAGPIDRQLAFGADEQQTVNGTLSWSFPGTPYYVLALGSDAREGDTYSRTDTMVLIRVDMLGGKITMVSIPRDTLVNIEGYGGSKINAAYAYGAAGGAVRAVRELTGVPVNHVAVVHFEELVGLIDYLGGVTVNVPVDVYDPEYSGLVLSAGTQTLDGQTALAWARTRYGFENGDYQRQEDQRILITAIINRVLSLSPRELPKALEQVGGLIGTDMRCYNLVPLLLRFKLSSPTVYSCAIPTTSEYTNGVWFEVADEQAMQELLRVVNSGGDPSA